MYCFQMTSPSTSTTSGTLTTCTLSSSLDWFWEEGVSRGTGNPCFSQPWTRCTPIRTKKKKFNTTWINQELRCTERLREFTKVQYIGAIWNSLRDEDSSSIRHDHPLQHFTCDMHRESGKHEVKRRIAQQSESISTMTAKSRTQAEFASWTSGSFWSRSENIRRPSKLTEREVRISKKFAERSTRRLVSVTLITEFKVHHTQQSRKKTPIARKSSKDWFENHPNRDLVNRGFQQDWGIQAVQLKVEGVDHQHGQHGVLRAVRDLF